MRNAAVYSSVHSSQLNSFGIAVAGNSNDVVHQVPTSNFSVCGSSSFINGGSGSGNSSSSFFRDSQVCNDELLGSFAPLSIIDMPPPSSSLNYLHLPSTAAPGSITSTTTTTTTTTAAATNFMNEATFHPNFNQRRRLDNRFTEARPFESDIKHKIKTEVSWIDRAPTVEESRKRKAICVDEHQRPYHPIVVQPPLQTQRGSESRKREAICVDEHQRPYHPIVEQPPLQTQRVSESRKRKAICVDEHQRPYHPIVEQPPLQTQRLPVRRSQKITDKITALQKLVSPFGKTDTASVLQEASVYIKLLHEQIQMLSTPYFAAGSLIQQAIGGERSADLRSRGLCLVPVSFTRNIIRQDHVDQSISRRTVLPHNY